MNLDELKAALSVDEALAAARRRSRDEAARSRLEPIETPAFREKLRAITDRVSKRVLGEDAAALEEIRSTRFAELTQIARRRMADGAQRSLAAIASLRAGFDGVRSATDLLIFEGGPASPYISLDTAVGIASSPTHADTAEQGKSTGYEELAFLFPWENPTGQYAVINVTSRLGLVGGLIIQRDSDFFGNNWVSIDLDARLRLMQWWGPSLSEPSSQAAQSAHILSGSLSGGGVFDLGDIAQSPVQTACDVSYSELVIPTGGTILIEVVLGISYGHSDDNSYAELELGGDYGQLLCPAVQIQYLTPPPGTAGGRRPRP